MSAAPGTPTAWTPQRLWVPLPVPAGRRAGEVRGESSGCSGGESLETARRWGGRMAHGRAHAHRYARDLRARMSPTGPRWRGLSRTRIALGDTGPVQWEVGRTPAGDAAGCA